MKVSIRNRIKWGFIYIGLFIVSFVFGALSNQLFAPNFAGISNVKWDDSVGKVYTDIPYGDGKLNKFDLYVPADGAKKSYKLVLYIHAGGFTGGDKADDAIWGKSFASRGYVGATINYTLRNAENTSANVYQMSLEIKKGVEVIKSEAAKKGYNLDGMIVAGGSAGGTLAMLYAFRDGHESPIPVKAVIEMVGPASFYPSDWFGMDKSYTSDDEARSGAAFVTIMTGDNVTPDMMRSGAYKQNLKKISAWEYVAKDTVPTLCAYGELDKVAPFQASKILISTLNEYNVPHDCIIFPNSGHALNRDNDKMALLNNKISEYLQKYLPVN